jgi:GTPase SAR1 family protein
MSTVELALLPRVECDVCHEVVKFGDNWFHHLGTMENLCTQHRDAKPAAEREKWVAVDGVTELVEVLKDGRATGKMSIVDISKLTNVIGNYTFREMAEALPKDYDSASAKGFYELQSLFADAADDTDEIDPSAHARIIGRARAVTANGAPLLVMFVGDHGAGKSSLLWAWKNQVPVGLQSDIPDVMKAVVTGPEKAVVPNLKMMCLDTPGVATDVTEISENALKRSLYGKCHAIALVVDSTDSFSLKRTLTYWFKEFEYYNVDSSLPVFVVGNKSDIPISLERSSMQEVLAELTTEMSRRFLCSFWCVCSMSRIDQINGLMVRIQCTVAFPTSLIMSRIVDFTGESQKDKAKKKKGKSLNQEASEAMQMLKQMGMRMVLFKALTQVFKSADLDGDGLLNEQELHHLQARCYDDVRSLADISKQLTQGMGRHLVSSKGLSFPAFLMMMMMGTTQGRSDLVWRLLLSYGYDYDTTKW